MQRLTLPVARLAALALIVLTTRPAPGQEPVTLRVETPMEPPAWATLERELLRANNRACEEFFGRYFDDRGFLECVERWGGDDEPGYPERALRSPTKRSGALPHDGRGPAPRSRS